MAVLVLASAGVAKLQAACASVAAHGRLTALEFEARTNPATTVRVGPLGWCSSGS